MMESGWDKKILFTGDDTSVVCLKNNHTSHIFWGHFAFKCSRLLSPQETHKQMSV